MQMDKTQTTRSVNQNYFHTQHANPHISALCYVNKFFTTGRVLSKPAHLFNLHHMPVKKLIN